MPRNNSAARRAQRRNRVLMQSSSRNERLIGIVADGMHRRAEAVAGVLGLRATPEYLMTHSHFPGHKPDCTLPPEVCYATCGGR